MDWRLLFKEHIANIGSFLSSKYNSRKNHNNVDVADAKEEKETSRAVKHVANNGQF